MTVCLLLASLCVLTVNPSVDMLPTAVTQQLQHTIQPVVHSLSKASG